MGGFGSLDFIRMSCGGFPAAAAALELPLVRNSGRVWSDCPSSETGVSGTVVCSVGSGITAFDSWRHIGHKYWPSFRSTICSL